MNSGQICESFVRKIFATGLKDNLWVPSWLNLPIESASNWTNWFHIHLFQIIEKDIHLICQTSLRRDRTEFHCSFSNTVAYWPARHRINMSLPPFADSVHYSREIEKLHHSSNRILISATILVNFLWASVLCWSLNWELTTLANKLQSANHRISSSGSQLLLYVTPIMWKIHAFHGE